jgi:hypothetical protein
MGVIAMDLLSSEALLSGEAGNDGGSADLGFAVFVRRTLVGISSWSFFCHGSELMKFHLARRPLVSYVLRVRVNPRH